MIIFGLGTGRCGTVSLAALLNAQQNTVCFHEMNAKGACWYEKPSFALTAAQEFSDILRGRERNRLTIDRATSNHDSPLARLDAIEKVEVIGDVAAYYLPYVTLLAEHFPDSRFPVLKRDKSKTVASFIHKMTPIPRRKERLKNFLLRRQVRLRNHWVDHDGSKWRSDPKWDKCFPKFTADTLADAISQYWDFYYEKTFELETKNPRQFRVFDTNDLNTADGQRRILEFCGIFSADFAPIRKNTAAETAR